MLAEDRGYVFDKMPPQNVVLLVPARSYLLSLLSLSKSSIPRQGRTFFFVARRRRRIRVRQCPRPANVSWRIHTRAAAAQVSRLQVGLDFPRAQLAVLQGATSCMGSFAGWAITDGPALLPDPPFNSAVGLSRVEAIFSSPSPSCTALAFAVGDAAIVSQLLAGYPAVRPLDEWAQLGPLVM